MNDKERENGAGQPVRCSEWLGRIFIWLGMPRPRCRATPVKYQSPANSEPLSVCLCAAEAQTPPPATHDCPPSSRPCSSEVGWCPKCGREREGHPLSYEDLLDITERSETQRAFMLAWPGARADGLADHMRLAIIDVPRLVKVCMRVLRPNDPSSATGGQPPQHKEEK